VAGKNFSARVSSPDRKCRPCANFTIILQAAFSYQSSLRTFYVLTIWVCNFLSNEFGAKAACKILVKLTPGVNFTNILQAAFSYKSFLNSFYVLTI
jgi:hypothetical protein